MTPKISIRPISASQTLPLRQAVLWPNHPLDVILVPGDADAMHFGGFLGEDHIAVASLFEDETGYRLRKFAVHVHHQGTGHGRAMMHHMLQWVWAQNAPRFWLDARYSARGFYETLGFTPEGGVFLKRDVAYVVMSQKAPSQGKTHP